MPTGQNAISRRSAQSRRQYRRVDHEVRAEIERLARLPATPTAKDMQHELEQSERFASRVPPLRTIQNIARAAAVVDDSGPWRLGDGLGLNAGLVLDVLAEVIEHSNGRRRHLTREEAKWIVRIRRARPEIDPWLAYMLAREFMAGSSTHVDVDTAFLAFAPWRQKRKGPTKRWEKAEESFGLGYTRWGWWIK